MDIKKKFFELKFSIKYQMIIAFFLLGFLTIGLSQVITRRIVEAQMLKLTLADIKEYLIRDYRNLITVIRKDEELILESARKVSNYYPDIIEFRVMDGNNKILVSKKLDEIEKIKKYDVSNFIVDKTYSLNESKDDKDKLYYRSTPNTIDVLYEFMFIPKFTSPNEQKIKYIFKIQLSLSKDFVNREIEKLNLRFLYIGLGISILSIIFGLLLSEKFSEKIVTIRDATKKIGAGDFLYRITTKSIIVDEISELSNDINTMAEGLLKAEQTKLENERYAQEMQIAEQIQQTLLPNSKPELPNFQFGSIYYSAKEVGGDYYDWITIDEKHLGIICADVSGKGVPGAFVMAITRSVIRSYAPGILSPFELLKKSNALLKKDMKKGMFVSMWYGILNIETGHLRFANAGHNPLVIYRAATNDIEVIQPQGSPLGILGENIFNKKLKEFDTYLNPNDILVQYTDGVTEAFNANQQMFEAERLYEIIKTNGAKVSADEMVTAINTAVVEFVAGFEQSDDILIVTVKRTI